MTSGANHRRARLFADAALGRLDAAALGRVHRPLGKRPGAQDGPGRGEHPSGLDGSDWANCQLDFFPKKC
ncbi:MAG: hypothetical protein LBS06_07895 [Treponema sp.]|nr:hypothetical protein [Treponema sp.]